jgi:LuxR family maltose regulon positive regulatory protein
MEGQKKRAALRRRRIVPRPRLTSALDASSARVRLLIGSAGYGKTTLAEQWTAQDGRQVAWYRVRDAAVDVAVLGVGLAEVSAGLVPGCDQRVRARTRASTNPRDETELLAEMLAEDLAAWPPHAWLVLDDYHALCPAPEAETFVETLVRHSPVNVLITSRCRPAWISSRNILYGDVFELSQTTLAMTQEEAQAVLEGWNADQASGLIALADGWPAVVGLAGVLPLPADPRGDVPGALYDFFAEEVFQTLEPDVRTGLATLAVAPVLDRELACRVLGPEHSARIVDEGLRTGILDERGAGLDLHPLARTFLGTQQLGAPDASRRSAIAECLAVYKERRDWDAVFALIDRNGLVIPLEGLVDEALDELLTGSRLTTLERWVEAAEREGNPGTIFRLARAELLLRQGEHLAASTLASSAANASETSVQEAFRAIMVMATASHIAGDEAEAATLFAKAREVAPSERETRRAEWSRLMCLSELERDEAQTVLDALTASLPSHDPKEVLLESGRRLGVELKFGAIRSLARAKAAASLLPFVTDPVVRASFRSVLAWTLALSADYDIALQAARDMNRDAHDHRLVYVLPYAHTSTAAALAGLGDYEASLAELALAEELAGDADNEHARANALALRLRVLSRAGHAAQACRLPMLHSSLPHKALIAELRTSQALALASCGRVDEAAACAESVKGTTRSVEARVLTAAVDAVVAIKARTPGLPRVLRLLVNETVASGGYDLLITAYRASPELLAAILYDDEARDQLLPLFKKTGEPGAIDGAGSEILQEIPERLSKRELEVCRLVCSGLSNRQVGEILFISEKTVKAHLQHIFDKTGIRSRRALSLALNLCESRQAAPRATALPGTESAVNSSR